MDDWIRCGTAKHLRSGTTYGIWCRLDDEKHWAVYNVAKHDRPPGEGVGAYYNKQSMLNLRNLVELEKL